MKDRLQKILSARGIASRRKAEDMIISGRVTVNGAVASLGDSADPDTDEIAVDGKRLNTAPEKVYIMLNKPRGYVTTVSDDQGRPTVMSLVAACGQRVYPVGRLDMYSEGLLLMTNDGEAANMLAHPSNNKNKTYAVTVRDFVDESLASLQEPITIDGYTTRPAKVRIISGYGSERKLEITIHEGRNRQVRRLCERAGLKVIRLVRTGEGGLELGSLASGKWRYLTPAELELMGIKKNA